MECPVCKDPIASNGNYFLGQKGLIHWDCKRNADFKNFEEFIEENPQAKRLYELWKRGMG